MNRLLRYCGLAACAVMLSSEVRAQGLAIAGIEAKLFYSNTGRFSANILGNSKIVLYNIIIGEGGAEGPSEQTLVIVRVQGPARSAVDGLSVRIIATSRPDTLADREITVGTMNSAGNYYAACWLDGTGCEPVEIEVQLKLGTEVRRAKALIPFQCSE